MARAPRRKSWPRSRRRTQAPRPPMAPTRGRSARSRGLPKSSRPISRGVPRRDRHGGQRAGAVGAGAAVGGGLLPRGEPRPRRRMRRAGVLHRRRQAGRHSRLTTARSRPTRLRETLARFPRGLVKSRQPAALTLSQVTEAGTVYSLDEIARARRNRPCGGPFRPHGRRALRQRAGLAGMLAGAR